MSPTRQLAKSHDHSIPTFIELCVIHSFFSHKRLALINIYAIFLYKIGTKAELQEIVYMLKEVNWKELGIQLNVPTHILTNIDQENPGNESRKLSAVLQYWVDNETASWEKIVVALQRIGGHASIITNIQSKCMISPPSPIESPSAPSDSDVDHPVVSRSSAMVIGGVSLSVSARPIHSLEEQLSKFPAELLDSPCADAHLVKLSRSIAEWRDLSPYLCLSPAEERGILTAFPPATPARQRIDMLRTWRDKFGVDADYR